MLRLLIRSPCSVSSQANEFRPKIILMAEDYSIGRVEGMEISGSPRIGGGCGLYVGEHTTGIGYERMSRLPGYM